MRPRRFLSITLALLAAVPLAAGCASLRRELPTPTPIPTPSFANQQVYPVQRGTIEQQVKALGRVVAEQQATLYFRQPGRLYHLHVDVNQTVKKGDLLAEMDVSDLKKQVQAAQIQAQIAELELDKAMGKDVTGTASPAVVAARQAVSQAEAKYAQAQDALDQLLTGATQADLDAAKAAVAAAEAQLQKDQAALTLLQAGPTPDELTILRAKVDKARAALQQAQAAYDRVKLLPDVAARPESAALQQATIDYNAAQAAYDQAVAGPRPDDVKTLQQQIASDQKALDAARAHLAQLQAGPTAADVAAARQNVASARAALDAARANLAAALGAAAGTSVDIQIARKQAEIARLQLETLQHQLDDAQLRAPFDGVITDVGAQDGDDLQAYAPVVSIANPARLLVAVELQASDLAQVALGMPATIVFNAYPTAKLEGKVVRMPSITTGNTANLPSNLRTVDVSFPRPPGPVNLGDLANVTIDVQRKEGVLLVPTATIISAAGKTYVHVVSPGGVTKEVIIKTGISNPDYTEVQEGLQEGMKVLLPTTLPPTPVPASGPGG